MNLTVGGHLSYVYAGRGLTKATVTPNTVIAYERVGNHNGKSNVLYGDGRVQLLPATLLKALLASGSTRPTTTPTGR